MEFAQNVVQNIDFGAGGGTLSLLDPTAFDAHGSGSIAGFAAGDTISLAGDWAFHTLTNPTSATTHLTLTSGVENSYVRFHRHVLAKRFHHRLGIDYDYQIRVTTKKERGSTRAARVGFPLK